MPDTVTEYISGIPMERRPWYEDRQCLAELWEHMVEDGTQPLNVSTFLRHPYDWEPQYGRMRAKQQRDIMVRQARACRDARMGNDALKDGRTATDGQSAA